MGQSVVTKYPDPVAELARVGITDVFKSRPSASMVSFEDIASRVDRARALIRYQEDLREKQEALRSARIGSIALSVNPHYPSEICLTSHAWIGDEAEDRLLETFRLVFEKSLEIELDRVAEELRALNIGL